MVNTPPGGAFDLLNRVQVDVARVLLAGHNMLVQVYMSSFESSLVLFNI